MVRKRTFNTVRTDYLELKIAHYDALGNFAVGRAIRTIAREIFAPIDEAQIGRLTAERRAYYGGKSEPSEREIANSIDYAMQQLHYRDTAPRKKVVE